MASLVGRGLLSYETRISELWPAFGAGDKAQVRVADLMRHEAGLATFDTPVDVDDLLPDNIKANRWGDHRGPETALPINRDGPREYHAMTRAG